MVRKLLGRGVQQQTLSDPQALRVLREQQVQQDLLVLQEASDQLDQRVQQERQDLLAHKVQ